eukprot:COSAG02_NODE_626_length_19349_cov_11.664468_9_plen_152_part_00
MVASVILGKVPARAAPTMGHGSRNGRGALGRGLTLATRYRFKTVSCGGRKRSNNTRLPSTPTTSITSTILQQYTTTFNPHDFHHFHDSSTIHRCTNSFNGRRDLDLGPGRGQPGTSIHTRSRASSSHFALLSRRLAHKPRAAAPPVLTVCV